MKKILSFIFILSFGIFGTACERLETADPDYEAAEEYAHSTIIVDTHVDMAYSVYHDPVDISEETDNDFDYVKAKEGGLNAPFMSIYIPAELSIQEARERADSLISIVKSLPQEYPEKFAMATSPEEIKRQFEQGLISLAMGIENGTPLGTDLDRIEMYYNRGIRYITMAHSQDNLLSDSSYDTDDDSGLTELGVEAVRRMNQIGMMVDVSHLSDSAFYEVLEVTQAPVIASHSSVRHFTPGWERNMSDDMLKALAENGGVIMISFGSSFIIDEARGSNDAIDAHLDSLREHGEHEITEEFADTYFEENYAYATVDQVADHFDYVVNLIGIDHVGIGSDFDGVGNTLPENLKSAADLPNLILELMERGYTEAELDKIMHENIFRVWNKVEQVAETEGAQASGDTL